MVGVQHHISGLAGDLEGAHQRGRDQRRRGDRNAGVNAHHLDMGDRGELRHHPLQAPRREDERIAASEDDLPDGGVGADIVQRGRERRAGDTRPLSPRRRCDRGRVIPAVWALHPQRLR